MGMKWFGPGTNLLIAGTVVLFGIHWLRSSQYPHKLAFRWRAYRCWWASWVSWVVAWGLILWRAAAQDTNGSQQVVPGFDVSILILDNLNTFFLILMYFVVTRGNEFDRRALLKSAIQLTLPFAIGLTVMYSTFSFPIAYEIHRAYALAASVFVPILVGWAFNLRFGTRVVLIVGFVYGFVQPVVYKAVLPVTQVNPSTPAIDPVEQAITMVVALLKVFWAIVCTRVLSGAYSDGLPITQLQPPKEFHFWKKWPAPVALHAGILTGGYLVIAIWLVSSYGTKYREFVEPLAIGVGLVGGSIGIVDYIARVTRNLRST